MDLRKMMEMYRDTGLYREYELYSGNQNRDNR